MKIIAITGTPGTGKTALARELSLFTQYALINVASFINKKGLSEGYDRKRQTQIVDPEKLKKALIQVINTEKAKNKGLKGLIIDSHMSHFLPNSTVDLCIVTKCSLKTLKKRLNSKGYNRAKIRENLDAEIFDVCLIEALEKKHKILVVDTTKKSAKKLAKEVAKKLTK